ncbi:MAG: phage major tail tube protein [Chitinophagaceae bacterium]|nr:phage major tail tube protein [Chitinophagaceae bacterium]
MAEKISINRCTNANVYVNGNSFLGRADEITLPQIKAKMSEHKAAGLLGSLEYFAGVDKLEAKFKWNSFYPDLLKQAANPFQAVKVQVRASLETYEGGSRISQQKLVVYLTGQFRDLPLGTFKQSDNVELESNMSVTAVKMEINDDEIIELDLEANIYKVNGEDLLAQYRSNLGI